MEAEGSIPSTPTRKRPLGTVSRDGHFAFPSFPPRCTVPQMLAVRSKRDDCPGRRLSLLWGDRAAEVGHFLSVVSADSLTDDGLDVGDAAGSSAPTGNGPVCRHPRSEGAAKAASDRRPWHHPRVLWRTRRSQAGQLVIDSLCYPSGANRRMPITICGSWQVLHASSCGLTTQNVESPPHD